MSGPGVIARETVDRCQLCGIISETRPYGPGGEEVCFRCGMKNEDAAKQQFDLHMSVGVPRKRARKHRAGKETL